MVYFRFVTVFLVCATWIFTTEGLANVTSETVNGAVDVTKPSTKPVVSVVEAKTTPGEGHDNLVTTVSNLANSHDISSVEANVFVAEANVSINLSCPLNGDKVRWSKSGKDIVQSDSFKLLEGGLLEVVKPGVENYGEFQCSINEATKTVILNVKPYIHTYKTPKNVIEDDPFVMDCKAWGYPDVALTWLFNGSNIVGSDHYVFKEGQYYNNSMLRIPHTSYADSGLYECIATNAFGNNSMAVNVTIKDKFAALWPFLGICAEVVILCTVIFIYEKRRERRLQREQEVSDIEEKQGLKENGVTTQTEPNASTDVRQRNK